MKLEVGKYYKSRDGQKVGPMYSFSNNAETFGTLYADVDDVARAFYIDGGKRRFMGNVGDLIAEWIDDPVTGTLRELNVQVGDVVEWLGGDTPVEYTIGLILDGSYYERNDFVNPLSADQSWRIVSRANQVGTLHSLNAKERDIVVDSNGSKYCLYQDDIDNWVRGDFRMIERYEDRYRKKDAQPSPVITETVTTQRIVPGVYGRVDVLRKVEDGIVIGITNSDGDAFQYTTLSAVELTYAIATLTQIRDALTHNGAK